MRKVASKILFGIFFMLPGFASFSSSQALALGRLPAGHSGRISQTAEAEKALEALRRAYSAADLQEFFSWVSEDFYGGWSELRFDLSRQFAGAGPADLYFSVNHTLTEKTKVVFQIQWRKRDQDVKNGSIRIREGRAEFIFDLTQGEARLLDIRGESPFES